MVGKDNLVKEDLKTLVTKKKIKNLVLVKSWIPFSKMVRLHMGNNMTRKNNFSYLVIVPYQLEVTFEYIVTSCLRIFQLNARLIELNPGIWHPRRAHRPHGFCSGGSALKPGCLRCSHRRAVRPQASCLTSLCLLPLTYKMKMTTESSF